MAGGHRVCTPHGGGCCRRCRPEYRRGDLRQRALPRPLRLVPSRWHEPLPRLLGQYTGWWAMLRARLLDRILMVILRRYMTSPPATTAAAQPQSLVATRNGDEQFRDIADSSSRLVSSFPILITHHPGRKASMAARRLRPARIRGSKASVRRRQLLTLRCPAMLYLLTWRSTRHR
jgi:hypothetical protein